jgi:uncharacterized membrane protein
MLKKTINWKIVLSILLLLGAYAVRLSYLGSDSIWHDEAWTIRAFHAPFETPDDNTPYVYYIMGHLLWRSGIGDHPLAMRYLSLILGMILTAFAYRVGRDWFGWRWGWLMGALVALSPLLWAYSQESRAYIAVPLIVLGLLVCVERILQYEKGRAIPIRLWLMILGVQVIGLYTHNLIAPVLVWVNVALGLAWLYRRDWQKMLIWTGIEISAIVAYIPWLLTQSPSGTTLNTKPAFSLGLIQDIWASYFLPVPQQLADAQSSLTYVFLTTLCLILGVLTIAWVFIGKHTARKWMLISHVILVPIFTIILMIVASIDFHPRYMIGGVIGALLLCVASIRDLSAHHQSISRFAYGIILSIAVGLLGLTLYQIRNNAGYRHDNFQELAQYYATLPEDAVILVPFNAERALQDYYAVADHLGITIQAQFVNVPLYSDEQTARQAINALVTDQPRHVELLTWYQLPSDVRGMYPCLLAAGSQSGGETRYFHGLATQSFMLTHPINFQAITPNAHFRTAHHLGTAYTPTYDGACIRTDWAFPQDHPSDAHATFTLLNPFDQPIISSDQTIRADNNATVSNWTAGVQGSAYALVSLPDDAPLNVYTLLIGVYDDDHPSGFDRLDQAGNPAGKNARYEQAITAQGKPSARLQSDWLADNSDGTIYTGTPLDVTAYVHPDDERLTLQGDDWTLTADGETGLLWARFILPAGITGSAELRAGENVLRRYDVIDIPRTFECPTIDRALEGSFAGVGDLIGIQTSDAPQTLTLIWRGTGAMTDISYTVFAQYLAEDGTVIAQSDSIPAQGNRPTLGWMDGEYITDTHTFPPVEQSTIHRLIVGLYDGRTFERVVTDTGETFVEVEFP